MAITTPNNPFVPSHIPQVAFNYSHTWASLPSFSLTPYGATHLTHNLTRMPFMRKILTPPTTLKGSIAASVDNTTNTTNFTRRHQDDEAQELTVYEFNEQDRGSPLILPFNRPGFDMQRLKLVSGLGMIVPFTNKLFSGSLRKRLGITAGLCMVIRYNQEKGGCLYEATYSFYFGDLGHISVQGPYTDYEDTVLCLTGGTGIFMGVYGTVTLKNVKFPTCLFYRFQLYGIPKLPSELIWETVAPTENVKPFPNASSPGIALRNFTD